MADRYEFSWTENEQYNAFGLYDISADCARGLREGLESVPTVSNIVVKHITETVEDVTETP
jgi:hypothetical protein